MISKSNKENLMFDIENDTGFDSFGLHKPFAQAIQKLSIHLGVCKCNNQEWNSILLSI